MSAKTTKVTLLATTVLLSALYQSHAFANELSTEPNAIVKISDVKAETTDEVTSSEVVTNSSSTEEDNGEPSSEIATTAPVATDDVTNTETVTNSNVSDANSDAVGEQGDSASNSNDAPEASDAVSTSVEDISVVENVNSEQLVNLVASSDNSTSVLPQVQAGFNISAITNTVSTSSSNKMSSSSTQNSSSSSPVASNDANSEEVTSDLSTEVDDASTVKESAPTTPRSVIANAPVQAASSLGLSSVSNVVSSKSTIGQRLFFGLILALMFAFGFSTYNKKKKSDLSYL